MEHTATRSKENSVKGAKRKKSGSWPVAVAGTTVRIVIEKKKKVGFTSFFPRFTGPHVPIQCMSATTHSLSNQTF